MIDELFDLPIPQKVNKEVVDYLGKQKWSFVNDNDEKYSNSLYDISTNHQLEMRVKLSLLMLKIRT